MSKWLIFLYKVSESSPLRHTGEPTLQYTQTRNSYMRSLGFHSTLISSSNKQTENLLMGLLHLSNVGTMINFIAFYITFGNIVYV